MGNERGDELDPEDRKGVERENDRREKGKWKKPRKERYGTSMKTQSGPGFEEDGGTFQAS